MDIKKIYISGKITGQPIDEVISKFQAAEAKIRRFGFEAVKLLLKSDAIYMMADWRQSEGAMIEYLVARRRRMRIFLAETFDAHASVESKTEQSHETEA